MKKLIPILITLIVIGLGTAAFLNLKKADPETSDESSEKTATSELSAEEKVWQQRADAAFEDLNCPKVERQLDPKYYQGPMIDTHIHIPAIPDGGFNETYDPNDEHPLMGVNVTIEDFICMLDSENTSKVFAFFPAWDPITQPSLDIAKATMKKYPGRFVPFLMPPEHDDKPAGFPTIEAEPLEEMLNVYPKLFRGYGEIGLYARNGGAKALPPDSQRLLDIYPVIKKHNLIVYFHLGEGQRESFEKILDANPDINFIWHGDQLVHYENGGQNLEEIDTILSNHSNVYYGVDELYGDTWLIRPGVIKEEFLAHFRDYETLLKKDLETWQDFIEKHQDQVLWGTDRGWSSPWSLDPEVAVTLNNYTRAFISRLDPAVQEKFAYKNAEKLIELANN